jgi:NADH-quinone oxidoreductase subunit A
MRRASVPGEAEGAPLPSARGESRESMTQYFQAYGTLAGLLVLAIGFVALAFGVNWALRPQRPTAGKLTTYESGMQPIGSHWGQTQIRYYVFAFLFVIFDVESVFLFPWALVFSSLGAAALWEMVIFIAVLAVGLLYAFRKGVLKWV